MSHKYEIQILCENVKTLRMREKLSRKEMASRLGIGVFSLTKLETGILPPRLTCQFLFSIHARFGVSPTDMFTKNGVCADKGESESTVEQSET